MIKQIILTCVALVCTLFIFNISDLDLIVQNHFYDAQLKQWLVDDNNVVLDFIFYSGIKKLFILFAVSLLAALIFFYKTSLIQNYKQGIIIVLLSIILVPVIISELKALTNVPCPNQITLYGGVFPHVSVLQAYPDDFTPPKRVKCFPAGHASGGFALMALFFLFKRKRNQRLALVSAISIGWITGAYKMLIGDHFLSHTIVTMLLAWLIILLITTTVQWYENQVNSA